MSGSPENGVTIQKRVNGVFSEILEDASIATDPSDTAFYKRVRVQVSAQGSDFEVRVAGWNAAATPPAWETSSELGRRSSCPSIFT